MITSDEIFAVFYAGSAATAGMVLVAEACTGRADKRRTARRTTAVARTTTTAPAAVQERERADV
ncbi:hypothetical protein [Kitasatospora griseola]|uniref:hypothetical protein n=1 Tax=Kitasatospora griseola TaxID=2064 RepID=UPI00166FBAD0|nr:hypothetical protein [Kitasatospora griseola]GGR04300.1 hypothetical protein GCM10010195_69730 [Kitasatospora griseola]